MQIIPVIDLQAGHIVRAIRGERSAYRPLVSCLAEGSDAVVLARALLAHPTVAAAKPVLYGADLDALTGGAVQTRAWAGLLHALPEAELWLDAGFSSPSAWQALRQEWGAPGARVRPVYGSESLASRAALEALRNDDRAILSLDSQLDRPLDPAGCWQSPDDWPGTVIVMTLDRVGSGAGPDLATFGRLRALAPQRHWVGAGGLRGAGDLAPAAAAGAGAWLVASALHDGRF